jgi:hypothetical protein
MASETRGHAIAASVVVAHRADEPGPGACLDSISSQAGPDVEVLLVTDTDAVEHPAARRTIVVPGALVPQLWAAGIDAAEGEVVLLTAGDLVPRHDWLRRMRAALAARGVVAVGGAIEPGRSLSLGDWARYFCRYSPYMLPMPSGGARPEIAADNAGYDRRRLDAHRALWSEGFWEPFVHVALRGDGDLAVVPEPVVELAGGHSAREFATARFRHGAEHGRHRAIGKSRGRTLAEAATFPAVPLLMTWRAGRTIWGRGRRRGRFVLSAPVLMWFYCCWAAGELMGRVGVVWGGGQEPLGRRGERRA